VAISISLRVTTFRHRPVFVGDTIECVVTLVAAKQREGFTDVVSEWRCTNQHGKEVMTGGGSGIIRDRET
jgi:acyl dehydratase